VEGSGRWASFSSSSKPGKAYLVNITPRAERDLAYLFEDLNVDDSEAAQNWYRGLRQAILTLAEYPNRCAPTPETNTLRHLLYGRKPHVYRVIYRVLEKRKQIEVLHIRHGAKQAFRPGNLT
jgi:toxin ParE1/3/4